LAASSFRFLGDTAPVVAVPRGALRPIFGRVLACRCFLPNRFFSLPFGAIHPYLVSFMVARCDSRARPNQYDVRMGLEHDIGKRFALVLAD
jgi:hypothetical protein